MYVVFCCAKINEEFQSREQCVSLNYSYLRASVITSIYGPLVATYFADLLSECGNVSICPFSCSLLLSFTLCFISFYRHVVSFPTSSFLILLSFNFLSTSFFLSFHYWRVPVKLSAMKWSRPTCCKIELYWKYNNAGTLAGNHKLITKNVTSGCQMSEQIQRSHFYDQ